MFSAHYTAAQCLPTTNRALPISENIVLNERNLGYIFNCLNNLVNECIYAFNQQFLSKWNQSFFTTQHSHVYIPVLLLPFFFWFLLLILDFFSVFHLLSSLTICKEENLGTLFTRITHVYMYVEYHLHVLSCTCFMIFFLALINKFSTNYAKSSFYITRPSDLPSL